MQVQVLLVYLQEEVEELNVEQVDQGVVETLLVQQDMQE